MKYWTSQQKHPHRSSLPIGLPLLPDFGAGCGGMCLGAATWQNHLEALKSGDGWNPAPSDRQFAQVCMLGTVCILILIPRNRISRSFRTNNIQEHNENKQQTFRISRIHFKPTLSNTLNKSKSKMILESCIMYISSTKIWSSFKVLSRWQHRKIV